MLYKCFQCLFVVFPSSLAAFQVDFDIAKKVISTPLTYLAYIIYCS